MDRCVSRRRSPFASLADAPTAPCSCSHARCLRATGAWEHEKDWLVKDALLQDEDEDDRKGTRKTVSVYAFAPTKIANMAFELWYDLNVPRTFNFIMKYDPVAQVSAHRHSYQPPPLPRRLPCRLPRAP